jgi:hypothetical protein
VRTFFVILIVSSGASFSGSAVLFQTDFAQIPQGWVSGEEWVFGSFGASLCVSIQETIWSGELSTEGEPPARYQVPEGSDSVVIVVDHWLLLSSGPTRSDASSAALIQLWTDQSGWSDYIYFQTVSDTLFSAQLISTLVLENPAPNTLVGFRFRGELVSEAPNEYAEIIWQVQGMSVTAYGETLGLESDTWGAVKSLFR